MNGPTKRSSRPFDPPKDFFSASEVKTPGVLGFELFRGKISLLNFWWGIVVSESQVFFLMDQELIYDLFRYDTFISRAVELC